MEIQTSIKTIEQLPEDEALSILDKIRDRRLVGALEHARGAELRDKQTQQLVRERVSKQVDMLAKELVRLDKAMDAVNKRVVVIQGLRLQYGDVAKVVKEMEK